ncbi:hypothetical protein U9M48_037686 [Paspalum notatum var. saurae]|uniref:Uncharacterized protein n=1 Tax=Paspalum notatum var. saurae TaxID=547442 RepID=A0AAQ3XCN8_PASNO
MKSPPPMLISDLGQLLSAENIFLAMAIDLKGVPESLEKLICHKVQIEIPPDLLEEEVVMH